ncbi:hypothetical protein SAMN05216587_1244 [Selenomonas ruminantium]|uniref:Uncharacterized protein n=1 Tax=Selenomonas ruminantium TaxID=971 RepID=A0A1I0YUD2_SELRU|nr:hypothetical protein SAMN05216587_1244 [Selenomonas ruminantium]
MCSLFVCKENSSNRRKDCPANLPNLHEKELIIMGFTALCVLGLLFFLAWASENTSLFHT